MNENRHIYNTAYSDSNLRLAPSTSYDREMIRIRFSLIERYGRDRDVLDLCCGTGSYLLPVLRSVRTAVGVDFSGKMLQGLRAKIAGEPPRNLKILEEDAAELSLPDRSVDLVYSFASLYHVPDPDRVLTEVRRVLRPGGYAALELGNLHSINTLVSQVQWRRRGWARPYHIPYAAMMRLVAGSGLDVVEHRSFQLLPMYGTPRELLYLLPLTGATWKRLMGIVWAGRMIDERISSSWPLRLFAFRHLFVLKKPT